MNKTISGFQKLLNENTSLHSDKTLRERIGNLLLINKFAIIAALIVVFLVGSIRYFFPGLYILGIPLSLLAIWVFSWLKGVGWSDVNINRPKSWGKIILLAVGLGIGLQTLALLQIKFGGPVPDISSFEQVKNNAWVFIGFLAISWTTAGFGEEVVWRGFFMKQIARLFNQEKMGWGIGLILSAVMFGLIHAYQGLYGVVMTGFAGFLYGIIFLASGRNLWAPILAHAITDTLGFLLLYNWDIVSRILDL